MTVFQGKFAKLLPYRFTSEKFRPLNTTITVNYVVNSTTESKDEISHIGTMEFLYRELFWVFDSSIMTLETIHNFCIIVALQQSP